MSDLSSPFIKALSINDLPPEAWTPIHSTGSKDTVEKLYRAVPWLYRGVGIRADAVASIPFEIRKGENVIDDSGDYQNRLKFLPSLKRLLWLTEAGLTLTARYYWFKEKNVFLTKGVRQLNPMVVKEVYDDLVGLKGFERYIGNREKQDLEIDDVIYFWLPDPYVEIGPAKSSPANAALLSAGVLSNLDEFIKAYFKRGAIKATMLTLKGMPNPAERQRFKSLWKRAVAGVRNAWRDLVVNADAVTPVIIGEGLESLSDKNLTTEKREDISTALGIPQSILFSNAANFAVSQQDKRTFYDETAIPDAQLIQDTINEQLLMPMDYRLVFMPDSMDVFQEDEQDRSGAFLNYVNAGLDVSLVGAMLGLELPFGLDWETLEIQNTTPEPVPAPPTESNIPTAAGTMSEAEMKGPVEIDLDKWRRKSLKSLKKGNGAGVSFESDFIPPTMNETITEMLELAENADEIGAIFDTEYRFRKNLN